MLNHPKSVGCALALITLALFWPATRYGFIDLDDDAYVSGNPYVQQGLTGQSLAWATATVYENYWLPATWISFMTDRTVQGPGPQGYHRTNVLLHAANVFLLFLVGYRLTGHLWGSALLAALFGWHPLRVEAVVWISSRKDVLSTFFGLLALLAYVRYVRSRLQGGRTRARWNYLLAVVAMAAALMAKPMLVTLPFLLLLLDFWPLKRLGWTGSGFRQLLLEKVPFLLLAAAFSCVTLLTHQSSGPVQPLDTVPMAERLVQIPTAYGRYLSKTIWPARLAVRYPPLRISVRQGAAWTVLLLAGTALCFWRLRRWPWALVGWLWFLGSFVPIIGLVRIGTADFADRFTYVPSIGLGLLVTGGILLVLPRRRERAAYGVLATVIILAVCGMTTRNQMRFWADGEILFRRALQVTGDNAAAHNALGRALERQGRWQEALVEYQSSLSIAPDFVQAHVNLGNIFGTMHRYDEAAAQFEAALQGTVQDAKVHSNYGAILSEAGRRTEGVRHLREAIRLNPHLADAHFNLGQALLATGEQADALEQFVLAARINPEDDAAQFQAGKLYLARGEKNLAQSCFEAALKLKPDNVDYLQALREAAPK